jgi:hypothetical protein
LQRGFTGTTQKQSRSRLGGKVRRFHAPKDKTSSLKCEQHAHYFLSTSTALCITKLFNRDKLQTSITALTPYGVYGKMRGENDLITLLCLCVPFWQKQNYSLSTPSLLTRLKAL